MSFFTILALVIFGFYGSKRNQFYKASGDGFFFCFDQVPPTGRTANTQDSSFNNDLV